MDNGLPFLACREADGAVVDLTKEGVGELAGSYMGSKGWRADYSEQRFVDDLSDLTEK